MRELGTVLGVWAHPDDESFLSAGVMAAAARDGNRVVCVTATRGEKGISDEKLTPEEIGRIRESELIQALRQLGVMDHILLGYIDGECSDAPKEEAVGKIEGVMRQTQPDSVLTFGPDGMTGHADHMAVSAWVTEAFERAGSPGSKLYYATTTPEWVEKFIGRFAGFNLFEPGTPPMTPREELGIAFELPDDILEVKVAALESHQSQVQVMLDSFGEDFIRESGREEFFRLAAIH